MAFSVTMPALGESVTEGTITRWLKQEGETVEVDEPLLEVSTDKVDTEIPSPAAGVLTSIKVAEDETVEVGTELATIGEGADGESDGGQEQAAESEPTPEPESEPSAEPEPEPESEPSAEPEPEPESKPEPQPVAEQKQAADPAGSENVGGTGEGAYVTPLVRKLAAEHGVDLASVQGTGVGGRIRKQDVIDAAAKGGASPSTAPTTTPAPEPATPPAPKQTPPPEQQPSAGTATSSGQSARTARDSPVRGRSEPLTRLRKVIATRMVESLQVSAQLTQVVEVDVTQVARLRSQAKDTFEQRNGVRLTFLPFFTLATVEALQQHPKLNASIDVEAGTVTYHDAEHLALAVDTERGLLAPVIHDAGDLNLGGLARKIADLAERTRTNNVTPEELSGGTFTLTNLGSVGALWDTPIINQPQVGILGTGSVVRRPMVLDDPELGEVVTIRSMAYLALSYDHRLVDGADAARFLGTIKRRLEEGDFTGELGL